MPAVKFNYNREEITTPTNEKLVKLTQIYNSVTESFKPTGFTIIWNGKVAEIKRNDEIIGKTVSVKCAKLFITRFMKSEENKCLTN